MGISKIGKFGQNLKAKLLAYYNLHVIQQTQAQGRSFKKVDFVSTLDPQF